MLARSATLSTLALVALTLLGAKCSPVFNLVAPDDGALLDEDPVAILATLAKAYDPLTVEVRIDGVDLIADLGLVPPFVDEGGIVMIGGSPVTISGFTYNTALPQVVPLLVSVQGLPLGPHTLEVEATRNNNQGQPVAITRVAAFELLTGFTQAAFEISADGLSAGPLDFGPEGTLVGASLGGPFAGPPITLTDGGELQSGFVPVAEAFIE